MNEDIEDPDKDSPAATPSPRIAARARRSSADQAFDLWLKRGVHAMYDQIAKEPIPPELLASIENYHNGA